MNPERYTRLLYNLRQAGLRLLPDVYFRRQRNQIQQDLAHLDLDEVKQRVDYCNKLEAPFPLPPNSKPFELDLRNKQTSYQLDLFEHLRCFDRAYRIGWQFGDVTEVPSSPAIVKSRPIMGDNANAVLMNLNKVRHFIFVRDKVRFTDKEYKLVWRGHANQAHRKNFLRQYHDHPRCDVGHAHKKACDGPWEKPRLSIADQLRCKFVLSIEGNDVATNLKWILSSNSLCFMTPPRFETWFMEGQLQPDLHYVALKSDYSDLEEKMDFYQHQPDAAEAMLQAAQAWVDRFRDPRLERTVARLVLWRYFHLSGQCKAPPL